MEREFTCKSKIIKFLQSLSFCALVIAFVLNSLDVFNEFSKEVTSFGLKTKQVKFFEVPILTICTKDVFKDEVLRQNNISSDYFYSPINDEIFNGNKLTRNVSFETLFHESAFILGTDFKIHLDLIWSTSTTLPNTNQSLKVGLNQFNGSIVTVKELPTMLKGMCYTIIANDSVANEGSVFRMKITKIDENISGFDLYITSDKDYFGLIYDYYEFGNYPTMVDMNFGTSPSNTFWTELSYEEFNYHQSSKKEFLTDGTDIYYECKYWEIMNQNFTCQIKCAPFYNKILLESKFNTGNYSLCITNENLACVTNHYFYNCYRASQCPSSLKSIRYNKHVIKMNKLGRTRQENPNDIICLVNFQGMTKFIHEEYLVYTFAGFVGNVGGNLGLFLGFSFFDFILKILSFL